jgi:hypothetical protein
MARRATLGNENRVTMGNCAHAEHNVRWLRAAFGGGLIDIRPTTQIESGAFCFLWCPFPFSEAVEGPKDPSGKVPETARSSTRRGRLVRAVTWLAGLPRKTSPGSIAAACRISNLDLRLHNCTVPREYACVVVRPTYPSPRTVEFTVKACDSLAVVHTGFSDDGRE